jgi:AcrR family transcriptional regulator
VERVEGGVEAERRTETYVRGVVRDASGGSVNQAAGVVNRSSRPLPRGPHSLSAEEVTASQRERVVSSVIEVVAEKGYVHTSVADIIKRAGVSRLTFYQLFSDKEDCFVSASESRSGLFAEVLEAVGAEVTRNGGSVAARIDRILQTYLAVLQSEPASAKALMVEVYAAGSRAIEQRDRSMSQFVDVIARTLEDAEGVFARLGDTYFAAQVLVGAVSSMVTGLIGTGQIERLGELQAPLVTLLEDLQ